MGMGEKTTPREGAPSRLNNKVTAPHEKEKEGSLVLEVTGKSGLEGSAWGVLLTKDGESGQKGLLHHET